MQLDGVVLAGLRRVAAAHGCTPFMVLLSAHALLLHRLSGQDDLVLGVSSSGRPAEDNGRLIGYCAHLLPVRLKLQEAGARGEVRFAEWLRLVREHLLDAYDHARYPFAVLLEEMEVPRQPGRSPLVDFTFSFERVTQQPHLPGVEVKVVTPPASFCRVDLEFNVLEHEETLRVEADYSADLFDPGTIDLLLRRFATLLEGITRDPSARLDTLPLQSATESDWLLRGWSGTCEERRWQGALHEVFETQVVRTPRALAVTFEGERLTYEELNRRANQLAHLLRDEGVGPEERVALCLERSVEQVVAVLGILKAGGAYVPMDPAYPTERLEYLLRDSCARRVLTQQRLLPRLGGSGVKALCLDERREELARHSQTNPKHAVDPRHLAYIIYTSGSTGQPKGVMVPHSAVMNLKVALDEAIHGQAPGGLRMSLNAPLSFDASVEQLVQLANGHTLCLIPEEVRRDARALLEYLRRQAVDVLDCTPSHLRLLLEEGLGTQERMRILVGGEAMDEGLWARLVNHPDIECFNVYGPTECTVNATLRAVRGAGTRPTIGRPLANVRAYVLDPRMEPAPVGVSGELYLGGEGVARGYLGRPELTAERFVPDPFSSTPGARMYRTGDLVRWVPEGELEYLGRTDFQVKVRGFRIELGEVEAALAQHPSVMQAVVLAREDTPGDKRLVAYVVAKEGRSTSEEELRAFLTEKLPEYMVPSAWVTLEALPLTAHGKVDLKALATPKDARRGREQARTAPRTPVEERLTRLWEQLLRLDAVGIHDDFFALGGDSILCIQMVARARQAELHLTPALIYQHRTIARLAEVCAAAPAESTAEQGEVVGEVPLTPIQRWFFEHEHESPQHWNLSVLLGVRPEITRERVHQAFHQLVRHHDALRLRFHRTEQGWRQRHVAAEEVPCTVVRPMEGVSPRERKKLAQEVMDGLHASLDLEKGPVLRLAWFEPSAGEQARLFIVVHHLVMDAVSLRILLEDLGELLDSDQPAPRAPKTMSFKAWAERISTHARSEALLREKDYWQTSAALPPIRLPRLLTDTDNRVRDARSLTVMLGREETDALLHRAAASYNTEFQELLLAALLQAFTDWVGEPTLLIDLEGHGREALFEDGDLSRTVGWFTSRYPVWLSLEGVEGTGEVIKAIKEQLRAIPGRGVGYGLLRYLGPEDIASALRASPEPEVSFNYLGQFDQSLPEDGPFRLLEEERGAECAPDNARRHLLSIDAMVLEGCLRVEWSYSAPHHEDAVVRGLADRFLTHLRALLAHCLSDETNGYTPSDFAEANLDQTELDELVSQLQRALP